MHFFWWIFWMVAMSLLFSPMTPIPRGRGRQTPLEILRRRYAASEISTEKYEEHKAKIERDTNPVKQEIANQPRRFLPVGWFWCAGASAMVAAYEMADDGGLGVAEPYGKHKM